MQTTAAYSTSSTRPLGDRLLGLSDNLCILFGTLAAFCVGQGFFWIYVGSKQYENVIKDKVDILKTFLEHPSNKTLQLSFCENIKKSVTDQTISEIKQTNDENVKNMWNRFARFISFTFSCFVILLLITLLKYRAYIQSSDDLSAAMYVAKLKGFLIGLFFVLFSFSTEIFIFLYVIRPYVVIGDMEMLDILMSKRA